MRRLLSPLFALTAACNPCAEVRDCVDSHIESHTVLIAKPGGGFHYIPQTRTVCDEYGEPHERDHEKCLEERGERARVE